MVYKLHEKTWIPANLRQDLPDTSFPADLSTAVLPDGYAYCHPSPQPACGQYEQAVQADPVMVDGKLIQQWTITSIPASVIASTKLSEIRAERKRLEAAPIELDGVLFDMDATARAKYVETMLTFVAFPELEIPGWKASDNEETGLGNYVTMTKALLEAVWALALEQNQKAFAGEAEQQLLVNAELSTNAAD